MPIRLSLLSGLPLSREHSDVTILTHKNLKENNIRESERGQICEDTNQADQTDRTAERTARSSKPKAPGDAARRGGRRRPAGTLPPGDAFARISFQDVCAVKRPGRQKDPREQGRGPFRGLIYTLLSLLHLFVWRELHVSLYFPPHKRGGD